MNRVFGLGDDGLSYVSRLKRKVFYSLLISVVFLNILLATLINVNYQLQKIKEGNFLILDLNSKIKTDEITTLETELLKIDKILKVKYVSKEESFKNMQNELNISIPRKDNPLNDSIIVYLTKDTDPSTVQEIVENFSGVREVFKDEAYMNETKNEKLFYNILVVSLATFTLAFAFLIIYIFNITTSIDFFNCINVIKDNKSNLVRAKRRNLILFTASYIIGILIFFNLYLYSRDFFIKLNKDYFLLSFHEILNYHLILMVVLNLLIWIIPVSIFGIDVEKILEYEEEEYEYEYEDDEDED